LLGLLSLISLQLINAQDLQGAWETVETDSEGLEIAHTLIFADNYFSEALFEKATGKFLSTLGGTFTLEGNTLQMTLEYYSINSEYVGSTLPMPINLEEDKLKIGLLHWSRLDDTTPGALHGAWLISGRKKDGEIVKRDTSGPRKTMKILSGTRFQWIAYNTETKEFMGTGGGTYTTVNGKYEENIGFFSRDDSRVGASLQFNFELKNGDWHHSGLSSKGRPIYEVWSERKL